MNATSAIISAVAGVLIAATGTITALRIFWTELKSNSATTEETHKIVNSQRDAMLSYQAVLIARLNEAGITIPTDPSIGR